MPLAETTPLIIPVPHKVDLLSRYDQIPLTASLCIYHVKTDQGI
ncbi:hypothetical protein [Acinetobacter ursingii]|nr:hypothetical protein [Acinetobacter ursingii]